LARQTGIVLASLLTAALANLMRLSSPEFSGLSVMAREKVPAAFISQNVFIN